MASMATLEDENGRTAPARPLPNNFRSWDPPVDDAILRVSSTTVDPTPSSSSISVESMLVTSPQPLDSGSEEYRVVEVHRERLCLDCGQWIGLGAKGNEYSFRVHKGSKSCKGKQLSNDRKKAAEARQRLFSNLAASVSLTLRDKIDQSLPLPSNFDDELDTIIPLTELSLALDQDTHGFHGPDPSRPTITALIQYTSEDYHNGDDDLSEEESDSNLDKRPTSSTQDTPSSTTCDSIS
jgi:hypothetical protein